MYRYVALLLFLVGCGGGRYAETANTPVVKVVTATAVEYQRDDFPALTTADDAVNLAFKISGRVVDVPVAKGVAVKRGEIVARLDSRDVELQVEATKSALREAQSRLDRARRLFAHSAISEQEVESLENALAQAQSAYDNALDMLSETRILAPFDGVVERTYVDTFERVSSGQAILRIVNPISTTVGFTAPESLVGLGSLYHLLYSRVRCVAWSGLQCRD
jgi:RND family efflux transporter MFP subunit